jgi:multiple antibiotic resistance protein
MLSWKIYSEFFVGLMIALNPIGNIAFFLSLTGHQNAAEKRRTAFIAAITIAITVVLTIWLGQRILEVFGISIGSFRVGAGIALLLVGIGMVKNGADVPPPTHALDADQPIKKNVAVVPLAIPIVAGPATLGVIIAQTENIPGILDELIFSAVGIVAVFINWLVFTFAVPIGKLLGQEGINIATRIIGLILMAIAMESMSKGIRLLFPGLT